MEVLKSGSKKLSHEAARSRLNFLENGHPSMGSLALPKILFTLLLRVPVSCESQL
ncbi:MAG TPA: hypothetical protein VIH42_14515 [Thermoguttaceae bacterium]